MELDQKQTILLVCNKIREYLKELIRRVDVGGAEWKEDPLVLAFGQCSYIWFWEWINKDTDLQNRLIGIGIPCSKQLRDNLAHANLSEDAKKLIVAYIGNLCGGKFANLFLDYFSDDLSKVLSEKDSLTNSYNYQMNPAEI